MQPYGQEFANAFKSHSTWDQFPEEALQHFFDDSWQSAGLRPELFEPGRASFQAARRKPEKHSNKLQRTQEIGPMLDN